MTKLKISHQNRLEMFKNRTLFGHLSSASQEFLEEISARHRFTFQEFHQLSEVARDLEMWEERPVRTWWEKAENQIPDALKGPVRKKAAFSRFLEIIRELKHKPKIYPADRLSEPEKKALEIVVQYSDKKIFGNCPVASPKTSCCQLKTLDAVENCAFDCSYCTIQTFYGKPVVINGRLEEKLEEIRIDPDRFYHIGTGQSSDALVWGNRNGLLDHLCAFARRHPNILLEFKTKSANDAYFLNHKIPSNVVCSWSLNTAKVIRHEEYFTAALADRLRAARSVADQGVKVAFHFHPLVYYEGWDGEYVRVAQDVQRLFRPEDVLFVSFGSVTLIKPVIQRIRERGGCTKILQMEMVRDPHGKFTYPDEIKTLLFQTMDHAFSDWKGKVYLYLCMESPRFWDEVFGWHYPDNSCFERDFGIQAFGKIQDAF